MSLEAMNKVWKHSKAVSRQRLVLLAIADHEGEQGAWPSIDTIATMCNMSRRSVNRDISALKEMGELKVIEKGAPFGGQYRSNLYFVTPDMSVGDSDVSLRDSDVSVREPDMSVRDSDMSIGGTQTQRTQKNPIEHGSRITKDFRPTQKAWEDMEEHFPWVDLKLETYAFVDYWLSKTGKDATKLDWDRTWMNWIRKAATWQKPKAEKEIEDMKREQELRRLLEEDGD